MTTTASRIRRRPTLREDQGRGAQPAAERFIVEHGLNEYVPGERSDLGIIVQGGITNVLLRGLDRLEVEGKIPTLVLNVTHPVVPDQIADFCRGKRAVLVVEEGSPDYIEQAIHAILRKRDVDTKVYGKDALPMAGEYTAEVVTEGLLKFLPSRPTISTSTTRASASRPPAPAAPKRSACWVGRCRSGHRASASAAPSCRRSRRSSSSSARSARSTSRATSAAIRLRPWRRSISATRSWASACRSPRPARWRRSCRSGPSR